tara:strand:- start:509 stop:697 length:189 start_codon:yes stop_codon:yes gene_type:complete
MILDLTNRTYKLVRDPSTNGENVVLYTDKNGKRLYIPFVPDNTDYQEYLAWVAEGNTAEPAD